MTNVNSDTRMLLLEMCLVVTVETRKFTKSLCAKQRLNQTPLLSRTLVALVMDVIVVVLVTMCCIVVSLEQC